MPGSVLVNDMKVNLLRKQLLRSVVICDKVISVDF